MSEKPFMQLYVGEFVGDTLALSAEHIGAYMLLLIALWNADGELEDDEETLSRVARVSVERWRVLWAKLARYFEIADGKISHNRVTKELDRFARKRAARSEAGRKGGIAKALKDKRSGVANAMPMPRHLPETRNKRGNASLVPTERSERVDRNAEPEVFAACLSSTGETVPDFITAKSFPLAIVAEARKRLAH